MQISVEISVKILFIDNCPALCYFKIAIRNSNLESGLKNSSVKFISRLLEQLQRRAIAYSNQWKNVPHGVLRGSS